jgi:hypothetical protein
MCGSKQERLQLKKELSNNIKELKAALVAPIQISAYGG